MMETKDRWRFWTKVSIGGDGCWEWQAAKDSDGYARFHLDDRLRAAYQVAYEDLVGSIPSGLQVDHVCHNNDLSCRGGITCPHRRCVKPAHLECVPPKVNVQRSQHNNRNAAKTVCTQGHPYDEANTYINANGKRRCRICDREAKRRKRAADPLKARANAQAWWAANPGRKRRYNEQRQAKKHAS